MKEVSVPYWGSLYFNDEWLLHHFVASLFPSPIGVLYISIKQTSCKRCGRKLFPSPIGVLYISIDMINFKGMELKVFPSPIGVLYISIKN